MKRIRKNELIETQAIEITAYKKFQAKIYLASYC